jgi:hypothetical protein
MNWIKRVIDFLLWNLFVFLDNDEEEDYIEKISI